MHSSVVVACRQAKVQQPQHLVTTLLLLLIVSVVYTTTSPSSYIRSSSAVKQSIRSMHSGCYDGTTDGFQDKAHPQVAACEGTWHGHVENSSNLCAYGWKVCGWDDIKILKTINWTEASTLPGCYAINAAQDDGKCRPCLGNIQQDDLAGVGSGCSQKSYGVGSCISGGQIGVSCCVDSHFNRACTYQPGLTTGVLCCRLPGVSPKIVIHPNKYKHATAASTFVLSCQADGSPEPRIRWLHNGLLMSGEVPRISIIHSGYLIISDAQPSDGGHYQCLATNQVGIATSHAEVLVTEFPSGCSDSTTDGLSGHEEIHACKGRWEGHVKRGRTLCAKGWQVCSPRHANLLKMLTWSEAVDMDGCYAYNAANSLNLCTPCYASEMAGVGKHCGLIRSSQRSCLVEGRIDVFNDRSTKKCNYTKGVTTGVLCCKRPAKWQQGSSWSPPKCLQRCRNGGVCVEDGRCLCRRGYKGTACQTPVCQGGCIANAVCIKPNLCRCSRGFSGPGCDVVDEVEKKKVKNEVKVKVKVKVDDKNKDRIKNRVKDKVKHTDVDRIEDDNKNKDELIENGELVCRRHPACLHGGRCVNGQCKCPQNYTGSRCHIGPKISATRNANRTQPKN